MGSSLTPASSTYIPEGINDRVLYSVIAKLLDRGMEKSDIKPPRDYALDAISEGILQGKDQEAIAAYYNVFIKTLIGTGTSVEVLLKLLGVNAKVVEWFNPESNLPSFKFELVFEHYPNGLDFRELIKSIRLVKNERARLATLKDDDCPSIFILSKSILGEDILDDASGTLIDGVLVCFKRSYHPESIQYSPSSLCDLTRIYNHETMYEEEHRLDYFDLGDALPLVTPTIQSTLVRTIDTEYVGTSYVCNMTKSATYKSQIVLSDYGSLSGGEGFMGESIVGVQFNLDDSLLSELVATTHVHTEFFWVDHSGYNAEGITLTDGIVNGMYLNSFESLDSITDLPNLTSVPYAIKYTAETTTITRMWSQGNWFGSWKGAYTAAGRIGHTQEAI